MSNHRIEPIRMPDAYYEKRTEAAVVDGTMYPANACKRCGKWFMPWLAGVPAETYELYCHGHDIDDAMEELLRNIDGKHLMSKMQLRALIARLGHTIRRENSEYDPATEDISGRPA